MRPPNADATTEGSLVADKDNLTPESDPSTTSNVGMGDVPGEALADHDLATPETFEITADEDEAEELDDSGEAGDEVVEDAEQLSDAELLAQAARDTRPVRKTKAAEAGPAKKDHATPKRSAKQIGTVTKRTTPAQFVRESAAELRKVVWPTASQLQQYFIVVLVFVLIIIAYVSGLDLGFGWLLLKLFG